jgi:hypothetical protein
LERSIEKGRQMASESAKAMYLYESRVDG